MNEELFPVVDELGNIVGAAKRSECHSGSMILHPVVHLHVLDEHGNIMLQKRSSAKDIQPGKWDTAVGGHVDLGENIRTALMREAAEELGIDASQAEFIESYVFQSLVEKELVYTHVLKVLSDNLPEIKFDPEEIDEVRFWSPEELKNSLDKGILTENFVMEYRKLSSRFEEIVCRKN